MKKLFYVFFIITILIFVNKSYTQNYDYASNFVTNNVEELIGVQLEILAKPKNVKCYGYSNFFNSEKILTEPYPRSRKELVYKKGADCSEYNSNYNELVHRIFTVSNVIFSNENYFLELKSKNETIYFLYNTKYEFSNPFLIIGYYEKFKTSINERSLTEIISFKKKYGVHSNVVDTILINQKLSNYTKSEIENIKLIQSLMIKTDEFTGVTWVSLQPYRYNKLEIAIHPYVSISENKAHMRLGITYKSEDWLFIDKIYLLADGEVKTFDIEDSENNRDILSDGIIERIDISLTNDHISYLEKFANSNNTKIKLSGKYASVGIVTEKEKNDINDIVKAYKILNKKIEIINQML